MLEEQLAVPAGRLARIPTVFHCFLPEGHRIGEPSPLVEEIKAALVEELKVKYRGSQAERGQAGQAGQAGGAVADTAAVSEQIGRAHV